LLAATVLFLLTYHGGSEEFLQRHNSTRNLRPADERISTTATIQGGAIGFRRIPSRRWSSVWNLADGRKNEQWANAVHATQLFPIFLDPRILARFNTREKWKEIKERQNCAPIKFFFLKIDNLLLSIFLIKFSNNTLFPFSSKKKKKKSFSLSIFMRLFISGNILLNNGYANGCTYMTL